MSSQGLVRLPSSDGDITHYLAEIKKFPFLTQEQEVELFHEMNHSKNVEAAHKLITSHLRLVVSVALKFKGYGLPIMDIIAEGNIGLMRAVKKFDPSMGYRLSTYAMWWIRASIQDYVLRSWSLVKLGTTVAQKKLFFSLNKIKRKIGIYDNGELSIDNVAKIAQSLNVPEYEVIDMNRRLIGHDSSLNTPISFSDTEFSAERQDLIIDDTPSHDIRIAQNSEDDYRINFINQVLEEMPERDRDIVIKRRLQEPPVTLESLSQHYNISRERVRQIEERSFNNLKERVLALANPQIKKQIEKPKKSLLSI